MPQLNRRTLLRSSGVALALPMLESMSPALGGPSTPPPKRMVLMCTALGLHPPLLWPKSMGESYETTPYLKLLNEHRKDFTLFSGLEHEDQTGRQPHDSEMTWLTAARKPGMGGFRNTVSLDQVAAAQIGNKTRFRSITLGTMKAQSQSFTNSGVMIPAETSPANLFAEIFLAGKPEQVNAQKRRLADGKSVLDGLLGEVKSLRSKTSSEDNHLLNDYFNSIRAAEVNIELKRGWMDKPKPEVDASKPEDILDNADLIGRTQLLMDLIPLIVQSDSSRVISVLIQDHFVVPKVKGVTGNHHNLSHHGQNASKIGQLQKIESEILSCFASLMSQMKSKSESGTSLLDQTSILFGSNLGNANAHHANNLPIFLAGGGFKHGRYVCCEQGTPLSNLFVTLLNHAGCESDSFGQSSGSLAW